MNPSETMTWAGPLPPSNNEAGCIETMTYAGPLTPIAVERAAETVDGGPILWAGPLPSWMERGGGRALTLGPSFPAAAVSRM